MPRTRVGQATLLGAIAAVALAGGCGGGDAGSAGLPTLIAAVGAADDPDAWEISLETEDGAEITTILPPGRYRLEIHDLSAVHSFHLRGRYGGADVATEVAGTGTTTAVVLLNEPESYVYFCDAHPDELRVTFSIHDRLHTQN